MKKAVFEVPTFVDAVGKSNRISPKKGAALDRAAGILIEVDPFNVAESVVFRATDLSVTFRMVVSSLELGDEPATWRIPSTLLHGIVSTLPMGSGSQITLVEKDDGYIYIKSGTTKAKLRLITGDFPIFGAFDPFGMATAAGLAQRLQQVAWATDVKSPGVLAGVHIDGDYLYGCDRASLAFVPCKVPVDRPVTAPLNDVASIIKNTSEVSVRASDTKLELMPDPYTQATSVLFAENYPNVRALMRDEFTHECTVSTERLISTIDRTLVLVKTERLPATSIEFGDGVLRMEMDVPEVGKVVDDVEVTGGRPEPLKMAFTPGALRNALVASGRSNVTIKFGPTDLSPIQIKDDNDYLALLMPRRVT